MLTESNLDLELGDINNRIIQVDEEVKTGNKNINKFVLFLFIFITHILFFCIFFHVKIFVKHEKFDQSLYFNILTFCTSLMTFSCIIYLFYKEEISYKECLLKVLKSKKKSLEK